MAVKQVSLQVNWHRLSVRVQEQLVGRLAQMACSNGMAFAFYALPSTFFETPSPRMKGEGRQKSPSETNDRKQRRSEALRAPTFVFAMEDLRTATVGDWRRDPPSGASREAFVFSPFIQGKVSAEQFYDFVFSYLAPTLTWTCETGVLRMHTQSRIQASHVRRLTQELFTIVNETLERPLSAARWERELLKTPFCTPLNRAVESTPKKQFLKSVDRALAVLKQDKLKKVVLSRTQAFPYESKEPKQSHGLHSILPAFLKALSHPHHQAAFVSWVSSPSAGTWLTVSPEILVAQEGPIFRTVSLAGTQPLPKSSFSKQDLHNIAWRDKDISEQALVSRYIVNCFKILRLRSYHETGPQTVQRGDLVHLQTEFSVNYRRAYGDNLLLDMLALLHPTSAVAGEPLKQALKLIQQLETHKRRYYTGFLGPLQIHGRSALYVNLRCAEWLRSDLLLYAGAGIVPKSDPLAEWNEIDSKLKVIADFCLHSI